MNIKELINTNESDLFVPQLHFCFSITTRSGFAIIPVQYERVGNFPVLAIGSINFLNMSTHRLRALYTARNAENPTPEKRLRQYLKFRMLSS